MNPEDLLVNKFNSLKSKLEEFDSKTKDEQHIILLDSASDIYSIFLDGSSLFDTVNKNLKPRQKITFSFQESDVPKIKGLTLIANICIQRPPGTELQDLSRKDFFKAGFNSWRQTCLCQIPNQML